MNSEELEQSLRTEFESYLNNVVAGMRQEVSDFQKMVETEFEKHRSQMDDAFRAFHDRFASDKGLDEAFTETVIEHLRLARDEGARITATAIAEAEELDKEQAATADNSQVVGEIRDAILEISGKGTQSAILKSLVSHAAKFTPRGAFFIIKNEHLVGWRVFGTEANADDKSVREVFFPTGSDTLLGDAVRELKTVEGAYGSHSDDSVFLSRLEFGQPDRMYAIPLVVRERAVAVLYADYGVDGTNVNVEALESLVQVAGLTVEISASAKSGKAQPDAEFQKEESMPEEPASNESESYYEAPAAFESATSFDAPASFEPAPSFEPTPAFESSYTESSYTESAEEDTDDSYSIPETIETTDSFSFSTSTTSEEESEQSLESDQTFDYAATDESAPEIESDSEWSDSVTANDSYLSSEFESFAASKFEVEEPAAEFSASPVAEYEFESVPSASSVEFESNSQSFDVGGFETNTSFEAAPSFEAENLQSEPVAEPVVEAVAPAPAKSRTRLSERNVDLPIEVSEDERRLHNDARRFARLLVSEIKLYNEQKVKEGRDSSDLYEKLKEAIDRSREMYDKRVQPPVAAKFDYFHYELVSNLAEGDEGKLGATYPGAAA